VTARAMIRPIPRRITYPIPSERTTIEMSLSLLYIKII
jgi:hypothetical protein